MRPAIETTGLGKRYRSNWALQECSFRLPAGRIAALVGPNGSGKTTLLHLAAGLNSPTRGSMRVLGRVPDGNDRERLAKVGFLAQDHPLYRGFRVGEMLAFGRRANPRWDDGAARRRLADLGIPLAKRVGTLSGGQQTQIALALCLSKHPELLLLDEPVSSLDPLARHEFLSTLMDSCAAEGTTVVLSSHLLADLERVCDFLIVLSASRVQVADDIDSVLAGHRLLIAPRRAVGRIPGTDAILTVSHKERQTTVLVRTSGAIADPTWEVHQPTLEEIVLGYLRDPGSGARQPLAAAGAGAADSPAEAAR